MNFLGGVVAFIIILVIWQNPGLVNSFKDTVGAPIKAWMNAPDGQKTPGYILKGDKIKGPSASKYQERSVPEAIHEEAKKTGLDPGERPGSYIGKANPGDGPAHKGELVPNVKLPGNTPKPELIYGAEAVGVQRAKGL